MVTFCRSSSANFKIIIDLYKNQLICSFTNLYGMESVLFFTFCVLTDTLTFIMNTASIVLL